MGTAYAVWGWIGAVGTVVVGMAFYQEPTTTLRLLLILAIVAAIASAQTDGLARGHDVQRWCIGIGLADRLFIGQPHAVSPARLGIVKRVVGVAQPLLDRHAVGETQFGDPHADRHQPLPTAGIDQAKRFHCGAHPVGAQPRRPQRGRLHHHQEFLAAQAVETVIGPSRRLERVGDQPDTRSPARWPQLSLYCLKKSTSHMTAQ